MDVQYDDGIVRHYTEEFLALGRKGYLGEDISLEIREKLKVAFEHLDIWVDGIPKDNKNQLLSQLRMYAGLVARSNPAQAKILMDAHQLGLSQLAKGVASAK